MAADLYPFGFRRALKGEAADLYLINTCTVTHRADQSSRNIINRATRENPNARIVVAGCYVDNDPDLIAGMPGVDIIIDNSEKPNISRILPQRLPGLFAGLSRETCSETTVDFTDHNRAWLKISDGCNQRCSFCILPTVRGKLQNRPPLEIIDEINRLVAKGFNEAVLTGVHVGHYRFRQGEPPVKNLAALCRLIIDKTDLRKTRISSIEPQTVRRELVQAYAESEGRICSHFHLPLQSGSTRILRLMRRPYDRETYIRRVAAIKESVPETIIGADVIVGFPGESDRDFEQSRQVCESGLIDYIHVFSYSDRPGTGASELPDKVNPQLIKERNAILSSVSSDLRTKAHQRQVGRILDVIPEKRQNGKEFYWGIADNYLRVKLPAHCQGGKQILRLEVKAACEKYIEGDIVPD